MLLGSLLFFAAIWACVLKFGGVETASALLLLTTAANAVLFFF